MHFQFSLLRLLAAVTCVALALAAWKLPPLERVIGDEPYTGVVSVKVGAVLAWLLAGLALPVLFSARREILMAAILVLATAVWQLVAAQLWLSHMADESRSGPPWYSLIAGVMWLFTITGVGLFFGNLPGKWVKATLVVTLLTAVGMTAWFGYLWCFLGSS